MFAYLACSTYSPCCAHRAGTVPLRAVGLRGVAGVIAEEQSRRRSHRLCMFSQMRCPSNHTRRKARVSSLSLAAVLNLALASNRRMDLPLWAAL